MHQLISSTEQGPSIKAPNSTTHNKVGPRLWISLIQSSYLDPVLKAGSLSLTEVRQKLDQVPWQLKELPSVYILHILQAACLYRVDPEFKTALDVRLTQGDQKGVANMFGSSTAFEDFLRSSRADSPSPNLVAAFRSLALQTLHIDLCFPVGLPSTASTHGAIAVDQTTSVLIVVDDFTRYYFALPLTSKTDAAPYLLQLITQLERRFSAKHYRVGNIICDRGTEFLNDRLLEGSPGLPGLQSRGIRLSPTSAYSPSQNGVSERAVGSISRFARRLLHHSQLPLNFWHFSYFHAAILLNQIPRRKSPTSDVFIAADLLGVRKIPVAGLLPLGSTVICFPESPTTVPKIGRVGVAHIYLGVSHPSDSTSQLLVYRPSVPRVITIPFTRVTSRPTDFSLSTLVTKSVQACLDQPLRYTAITRHSGTRYVPLEDIRQSFTLLHRDWSGDFDSTALPPVALAARALPPCSPAPIDSYTLQLMSAHLPVPVLDDRGDDSEFEALEEIYASQVFIAASMVSTVDIPIPPTAAEAFNDPLWKAAMDKEYSRLVELNTFESVHLSDTENARTPYLLDADGCSTLNPLPLAPCTRLDW